MKYLLAGAVLLGSSLVCQAQVDPKWEIHDRNRPNPPVVTSGTASTQDTAGKPPSDAVVLFDGKDSSHWVHKDGSPSKWTVADGYMFLFFSAASLCQELAEIPLPPNGDAEKAEVSQWIGLVRISIAYHSPRVHRPANNDRTGHIWGDLVKYGFFDDGFGPSKSTPWRAGANENTTITVSHDSSVRRTRR